jgi:hypothetical protein
VPIRFQTTVPKVATLDEVKDVALVTQQPASLLAQLGLTPKSKRGLVASDSGATVNADGLGDRQRAMETAQHWDRLAKDQPAEMSEFESPQPTTFKGV